MTGVKGEECEHGQHCLERKLSFLFLTRWNYISGRKKGGWNFLYDTVLGMMGEMRNSTRSEVCISMAQNMYRIIGCSTGTILCLPLLQHLVLLLNLCGKLIQRTNLYYLSAMKDPDFFFFTVIFPHRTTDFILWLNQWWNGSLKVCQRLLCFCQKYACFRRLFSSPFIYLEWYKRGSASVAFLTQGVSRTFHRRCFKRHPHASTWCHQHIIFVYTHQVWWRGGRPAWQPKELFEKLQTEGLNKSGLTILKELVVSSCTVAGKNYLSKEMQHVYQLHRRIKTRGNEENDP